MQPLIPLAREIMFANRMNLHNPDEWEPIFSFDKPKIHKRALSDLLPALGVVEGQNTFPLPRYGGDVHKVIEHVHGVLTKYMHKVLSRVRTKEQPAFYRETLEDRFWDIKASSVARDVASLPQTLRIIASPVSAGGTGGDWAPRPYS